MYFEILIIFRKISSEHTNQWEHTMGSLRRGAQSWIGSVVLNIRNMFMHSFYINVYKLGCMYYVNVYNLKFLTKNFFFFILFNLVGIIIFGRGTKEIWFYEINLLRYQVLLLLVFHNYFKGVFVCNLIDFTCMIFQYCG